ncbi:MAG: TGS domain-containing protein [Candidatus Aramenus sulfurataquae]|jgi:ribosome-interacting GTPase 1|uniref:GTP-binding protein n=2 Tax=Candidatus Aramenus sulfurataquae TaxID=1326980 RepID=W7KJQ2_9CREN|nr:MAG: TGS domain-containing protein [Candidatus Aramenus sulfurataquae]MCL7343791.1 TGS domain-containing protein [Candidatus Aramenus sulfurataquae]
MVTNLPAEAKAKWIKVMEAKTPEEKIKAIQDFLSYVPKHKGTENLVYWAKRRLAELREESEKQRHKKSSSLSFFVEKEGAGQILVLGKQELKNKAVRMLTNVRQDPKDLPVPAMTYYEDVAIQLVNPPPLILDSKLIAGKIIGLARNADAILAVVSNDVEFTRIREFLESNNILLGKPKGRVVIEKSRSPKDGIRIINMGKLVNTDENEVRSYLEGFGIRSAVVKVIGEVTLDDVEKAIFEATTYKPMVILSETRFNVGFPLATFDELDKLRRYLFESLDVIRVYTKEPGEKPTQEPLIMKRGATVLDVARKLHSALSENFKYARVWGPSAKFPGQKVGGDHPLEDKDIVEIKTK